MPGTVGGSRGDNISALAEEIRGALALIDRDKDDAEKLKENRAVIDAAKQQAYVGEARGSDVRRLVATEAQTGSKFG
jgi:hypothetical protein